MAHCWPCTDSWPQCPVSGTWVPTAQLFHEVGADPQCSPADLDAKNHGAPGSFCL